MYRVEAFPSIFGMEEYTLNFGNANGNFSVAFAFALNNALVFSNSQRTPDFLSVFLVSWWQRCLYPSTHRCDLCCEDRLCRVPSAGVSFQWYFPPNQQMVQLVMDSMFGISCDNVDFGCCWFQSIC